METALSGPGRDEGVLAAGVPNARRSRLGRLRWRYILAGTVVAAGLTPQPAEASMFHGETLDAIAMVLCWVVLVIAPCVGIVVFWLVHILPEKIAHKKHHPQLGAITTLCLLSLVFGGLLWPLAWIWAYTKPIGYKMAYGTDKVDHDNKEEHAKHDEEAKRLAAAKAELLKVREQLMRLTDDLQGGSQEERKS